MEKIVEQTLLYDFYGELLTEHQRRIYEDVVLNDYSLSEVAQELGISRQGVHDNLKRCSRILEDYEEKLHLVEKFVSIREKIRRIHKLSQECESLDKEELVSRIESISQEILEEL
ncbi:MULTISPECIES: YlxM family DNA-binding protein [unclassified Blautia]|uniref:UPF0122 protein H9914_12350 n=2 Tax=Blautia TaxID=572511 RepID=A0A9D2QXE6_9FIRM|nr:MULTISPECIES: YlxM family DNA-binding protein [unclassified Blautia]OUN31384.1 DNA-binding protein [Blautia sp. An81]OUN93392.1 DNA-binding protein [Blautia sp. An46]HJD29766.1 YlxM family DNA-binding protein [Candidatus Blautia avicola]HJD38194.1 YlxM family DNA-binding protein [Candidatus Blautia ornithocaccae]